MSKTLHKSLEAKLAMLEGPEWGSSDEDESMEMEPRPTTSKKQIKNSRDSLEMTRSKAIPIDTTKMKTKENQDSTRTNPTQEKDASSVIYLGHIPRNFEENEMFQFFSQFGTISNLKLMRSKRTGNPRGYAFIEFADKEVAAIAANTMSGYLLMGEKQLVCHVVPKDQVHPDLFRGVDAVSSLKASKFKKRMYLTQPLIEYRQDKHRKRVNRASNGRERMKQITVRLISKQKRKREKLAMLGIEYDFPGYSTLGTSAISTSNSSIQTMNVDQPTADFGDTGINGKDTSKDVAWPKSKKMKKEKGDTSKNLKKDMEALSQSKKMEKDKHAKAKDVSGTKEGSSESKEMEKGCPPKVLKEGKNGSSPQSKKMEEVVTSKNVKEDKKVLPQPTTIGSEKVETSKNTKEGNEGSLEVKKIDKVNARKNIKEEKEGSMEQKKIQKDKGNTTKHAKIENEAMLQSKNTEKVDVVKSISAGKEESMQVLKEKHGTATNMSRGKEESTQSKRMEKGDTTKNRKEEQDELSQVRKMEKVVSIKNMKEVNEGTSQKKKVDGEKLDNAQNIKDVKKPSTQLKKNGDACKNVKGDQEGLSQAKIMENDNTAKNLKEVNEGATRPSKVDKEMGNTAKNMMKEKEEMTQSKKVGHEKNQSSKNLKEALPIPKKTGNEMGNATKTRKEEKDGSLEQKKIEHKDETTKAITDEKDRLLQPKRVESEIVHTKEKEGSKHVESSKKDAKVQGAAAMITSRKFSREMKEKGEVVTMKKDKYAGLTQEVCDRKKSEVETKEATKNMPGEVPKKGHDSTSSLEAAKHKSSNIPVTGAKAKPMTESSALKEDCSRETISRGAVRQNRSDAADERKDVLKLSKDMSPESRGGKTRDEKADVTSTVTHVKISAETISSESKKRKMTIDNNDEITPIKKGGKGTTTGRVQSEKKKFKSQSMHRRQST